MSEVNNARASGTFFEYGPAGELHEGATLSCCHCQGTWILRKGSGRLRGFCQKCMGYVCGPACAECVPIEQRMENIEKGLPELAPGPVKIFVPQGLE